MAGTEDIIQNIVLAGQQDVIAGLDAIGNAGVKAFEAIGGAVGNLGNIGSAFAGLAGVTGAIAGVTAGIFALSDAASNNVVKMANFADEMGTTTGNMGLFITALNQAGNQTTDLTVSFRRIAVAVEAAWPKMQKQVRESADLMKEDFIKVGEAAIELSFASEKEAQTEIKNSNSVAQARISLAKAKLEASRIDQTNELAAIQASNSVAGAINNVAAAQNNLQIVSGHVSESQKRRFAIESASAAVESAENELRLATLRQQREEQDAQIRKAQALLDVKQKALALQEALTKQAEDAALRPFKQAEAELKLSQAQEKQKEDQVNSISSLKKFIDDLAVGADVTGQKVQISTQNVIKGLIASVGSSANALEGFSGNIGDVTTKTPALFEVMKKVADVFEHTKDATLRAALATALFGRGYSFTLVAALEEGGAALEKNMNRLRELGFEYTSFDEHVGRDFLKALNTVESELKILGTQMGLTFAPSFTVILRQIQQAVENNRQAIVDWAAGIRDAALPIIAGFLRAIAGIDVTKALRLNPDQIIQAEGWATSFDKVKRFIVDFAIGAKNFILDTLTPVFDTISKLLASTAEKINQFFGTKITAGDLGVGIIVLAFSNLIPVVVAATFAVVVFGAALLANPFSLVVIAVGLAVTALFLLKTAIEENKAAIVDFVSTKVAGAWNWMVDSFEDAATKIKRGFEDLRQQAIDTLTFSLGSTIEANNKIIEAARKAQDEATANARRIRDAATQTGSSTATNDPNSLTPSFNNKAVTAPIDEQKQKWFDLGKAIDEVTAKAKAGLPQVATSGAAASEQAAQATASAFNTASTGVKKTVTDIVQYQKDQLAIMKSNAENAQGGLSSQAIGSKIFGSEGSQQGGPQTTTVPKGQVLQDLSEVNKALEGTGKTIIRTFGGDSVQETKASVEGFEGVKDATQSLADATEQSGQKIIKIYGPGGLISQTVTVVEAVKQPLEEAGTAFDTFGQKAEAIKFISGDLANPFQQAADEIKSTWDKVPDAFQTVFDQIAEKAALAAQRIAQSFAQAAQSATSGGSGDSGDANTNFSSPSNPPSGPGFAEGGLFRGRGGIDTNLAWLTDMEFIMSPKAVSHWGVGFFSALNRLEMPGFSMGGLFRSVGGRLNTPMIPAFAGGGLNRSSLGATAERRALALTIGGHTFSGLSGPASVVDALELHAVQDQLKTSGYQPRWKK